MKKNFCLSDHNYNLNKRWYIRFIYTDNTGKDVNGKTYEGINRGKTVEQRLEIAKLAILRLEKEGAEIIINEINEAYFKVLEKIKPTLRPDSYRVYFAQTKQWLAFLESKNITTLKDITYELAYEFTNKIFDTRAKKTYNHYTTTLRTITSKIPNCKNVFLEVKTVANQCVPAPFFSIEQINEIKINCQDRQLWLFCQIIFFCLIRPKELRQIKISDIDLVNGTILVRGEVSKNKKTERVAIPNQLMVEFLAMNLEQYSRSYYLFSKNNTPGTIVLGEGFFRKRFKKLLKSLEFSSDYCLYSLKHAGAIAMVKAGIHIAYIKIQGRWHDLDQVYSYLRQMGMTDMGDFKEKHVM